MADITNESPGLAAQKALAEVMRRSVTIADGNSLLEALAERGWDIAPVVTFDEKVEMAYADARAEESATFPGRTISGTVAEAGGGMISIYVDRALDEYPPGGRRAWLIVYDDAETIPAIEQPKLAHTCECPERPWCVPHGARFPFIKPNACADHGHVDPDPVPEVCPHCHQTRSALVMWPADTDEAWRESIARCGSNR
jgi:hypothetical protein